MAGRFEIDDGEIIDTKERQIIPMERFQQLASAQERTDIEGQLRADGFLSDESPPVDEARAQPAPSAPSTPQAAPSARPSLNEFMTAAREDNPGVSDRSLRRYWAQNYSDIDPRTLPTWETFLPAAKSDNPGLSQRDLRNYWEENYGDLGAQEKEPSGSDAGRGFSTAFKQIPQLAAGVAAGAGAAIESMAGEGGIGTGLKQFGVRKFQEASKEIADQSKASDSFSHAYDQAKQGNFGALVDWLQYGLGYAGGQAVQMLATGGLGYVGGKIALQTVAKGAAEKLVAKEAARISATEAGATLGAQELQRLATANVAAKVGQLGQTAAVGTAAVGMEGGEIFGDLASKSVEEGRSLTGEELGRAFGATLAAGALEFVGDKVGLDLLVGKSPIGRVAGSLPGVGGRVARAGIAGTTGAAIEGGTEFAQTLIEEAGKGGDPFGEASIRDAIDATALGAVGGGAVGGATGLIRTPQQPLLTAPSEPPRLEQPGVLKADPLLTAPDTIGVGNPGVSIDEAIKRTWDLLDEDTAAQEQNALTAQRQAEQEFANLGPVAENNIPIPRTGTEIPILEPGQPTTPAPLPITQPSALWMQEAMVPGIEPGQAFQPRTGPTPDPREEIARERERLSGMRRSRPQEEPAPVQEQSDAPLRTAADLAFPPEERGRMPSQQDLLLREQRTSPRQAFDVPILPGGQAQPASPITSGAAFTPRAEPELSPRERIAQERERLLAMQGGKIRSKASTASELSTQPPSASNQDRIGRAIDKAYASADDIQTLAQRLSFEGPVLQAVLQQATGKSDLSSLSPGERDRFAEMLRKITPEQPAVEVMPKAENEPTIEAPEAPAAPALAPVGKTEMVQRPRGELIPEQNTEMFLRAEKAQADIESQRDLDRDQSLLDFLRAKGGLQDQGGELSYLQVDAERKPFVKNLIQPNGLTLDQAAELAHEAGYIPERNLNVLLHEIDRATRGQGSPVSDWYTQLTEGRNAPIKGDRKQSAREKIEEAIAKIIQDEGKDRGQAVEAVKDAILRDTEFRQTDWGRDLESILQGDWPSWVPRPDGMPSQPERPEEAPSTVPPEADTTPKPGTEAAPSPQDEQIGREREKLAAMLEQRAHEGAPSIDDLIQTAKRNTKREFLANLSASDRQAISDTGLSPEDFWRNHVTGKPLDTARQAESEPAPTPESAKRDQVEKEKAKLEAQRPAIRETAGQQEIAVPPEIIGSRPIIRPEAPLSETPLFSKAAQEPEPEQTSLPQESEPAVDATSDEAYTESQKPAKEATDADDRPSTDALGSSPESTPEGVSAEPVSRPPRRGNAQRPRAERSESSGTGVVGSAGSGPSVQPGLRDDSQPTVSRPGTAVSPPTVHDQGHDYLITPEDRLEEGGPKAKFKKNVAAIRLVKDLEREGRLATPEEQAVLVKYTGWGGLKNAFSEEDPNWTDEANELRELLTPAEYETARRSIQYAHYTDPKTIDAIWKALQQMGLVKGSVLEPAMGTGNFFGATPKALVKRLSRSGVEMDGISGQIAKQLYQRANIQIAPFQETTLPDNHFDVAVGNVPFSEIKVADERDKELNGLSLSLHNYFFAKSLRKVRPGGVVAFITSTGTMDNKQVKARKYLASQADLIAAYRLPSGTFRGIANTEVTTDIVILRKRHPDEQPGGAAWLNIDEYSRNTGTFQINEYFVAHPEHILGEMRYEGTMYRENSMMVAGDAAKAHDRLLALIEDLPEDLLSHTPPTSTTQEGLAEALAAPADVKPGAFVVQGDGKIYVKVGDQLVPHEAPNATAQKRIVGMAGIRDALKDVFRTQLEGHSDAAIAKAQKELGKRYDAFVKVHGLINSRANRLAYDQDPDYPVLQSLEKDYDPKTNKAQKADVFTKRTIEHQKSITTADSPQSALSIVLNETNRVDFDRMHDLTGLSKIELQSALRGLIFQDPVTGDWETASAYLSGNVREKLAAAKEAAKKNKDLAHNVEALEGVQPKDLLPSQIDARLGAGWIPPKDVEAFMRHLLKTSYGTVRYRESQGLWAIEGGPKYGVEATQTYGTPRMTATDLMELGLNSQVPTVYDTDRDGKRHVNEQATLAAREKLSVIKEQFQKWIWRDDERATRLAAYYNEHFNNTVPAKFDGSHLVIPGKNPAITLRPAQLNAVYRALQKSNTLLAHEVGTGKTYSMATIAMESRRLGLAKKPMIVVPNHLVEQWGNEFRTLFPSANVLLTTKNDFKKENRLKLMGKIATGDWDAVVVPFTSFTRLPISRDTFVSFMREQIAILETYIREEKEAAGKRGNRIVKDLEKAKERFENKIKARMAAKSSDDAVSFEETGTDMLLVDEADLFKNLYFPTRMTRVSGLPNTESQRAFDMYMKTRYLTKLNNGRGVVFATGTPISNSMAEVFTMQRYLQQGALEEAGLAHFDAWARMFGEAVTSIEMTPSGKYAQKTRFANFINVPELMQMFLQVMDVVTADQAKVERPPMKTGKPINVTATPGPALKAYVEELNKRVDDLKHKRPDEDNMLKITGDGRHAALDVRLRVPGAPEDKDSKINKMVRNVAEVYHRTVLFKGTQLIFLDLSTPKAKDTSKKETEDEEQPQDEEIETADEIHSRDGVYGMIRSKLIALKVKPSEIAFIHDAKTDKHKSALFEAVNAGKIRVLLGSTEKMGAGTNVQQRLVAAHDADAPWRPRDLEQRHGRILRFGNRLFRFSQVLAKKEAGTPLSESEEALYKEFKGSATALRDFKIEVYQYATEAPSFDVYMWQTLESKAKVIAQIMKGDPNIRTIQDVDATTMSASEMKALASGNPLVLEKVGVDADVRKYSMLKAAHGDQVHTMRRNLSFNKGQIAVEQKNIERSRADVEFLKQHPDDPFKMKVGKQTYTDKEEAGEALLKEIESHKVGSMAEVGKYRGFTVQGMTLELRGVDEQTGENVRISAEYKIHISREGGLSYEAHAKTPNGAIRSIDYALSKAEERAAESKDRIARYTKEVASLEAELGKPFEYEERLEKLLARQKEIDKALTPAKDEQGQSSSSDVSVSESDVPQEPDEEDEDGDNSGSARPANFSTRQEPNNPKEPSVADFQEAIRRGLSIGDGPAKLIDSSRQYPQSLLSELAAKPHVKRISDRLGQVFDQVRDLLAPEDPAFSSATYAGLSPDDYYVGVNLRGPDQVILNPWGALWKVQRHIQQGTIAEQDRAEYLAGLLLSTLVHELTHQQVQTTHTDAQSADFDRALAQNYAILGSQRLASLQLRLMDALAGGTTDALARDLDRQTPFWKERDRLSRQDRGRDAGSRPDFDRQNVAGEGAGGRSGPQTFVRSGRQRETPEMGPRSSVQRSDAATDSGLTFEELNSPDFAGLPTATQQAATETGTISPTTARDRLAAAKTSARPYLLGALGLQQLSEVYGRDHREVSTYNRVSQQMEADFLERTRVSDAVIKHWDKLPVETADRMARIMEDARFANWDPDQQKNSAPPSNDKERLLRDRFEGLPAEAKAVYREARDFYSRLANDRFDAIAERIRRAGGTPENTKAALDKLHLAYEKVRAKVYFPFSRFGDHIVVAKKMQDGKEIDREVSAFESPFEAQKFATLMKARGWTVKQTLSKEYSTDRDGSASKAVKDILKIIDGLDETSTLAGGKADLKDAINQTFIHSLPDMSYAKHFLHAKDVKGFSKDALRAFAHSALHGAHHISRINNADRLTKALDDLDARIRDTAEGDVTEARQVYNELAQRHTNLLNPNTSPVAAWLGQLGFTMSLGGVVATGFTNLTQVPLVTLPWLGARYGAAQSTAALARAYKDFLDPKTLNSDSLFDASQSLRLPESERAMLKELQRRGRIDLTQTMDLAGRASQDNLSRVARQAGTVREKIAKLLGFTFHAPEVMNRQVTALATYRLAKERGASTQEAIDKAEQAIIDTHFIYTAENRPRYMSGNVMRVLTMFKQYSQNIAFLYGRAAQVWLSGQGATPEERQIAKRQLLAMTGLQFAAAGALGMPFVGTVASLLTAILNGFGDDDEKKDWEVELRKMLADAVGTEAGEVLAHGVSRLTPWDMAGRLGQSDLFFRAPSREREGRAAAMDWATSFAGPVLGYAVNAYLGASDLATGLKDADAGHFMRGVEELTPAVLRNGVKALRFELEGGARTRDQYKQLDLDYAEKLGQFFGFAPARVAEMYESGNAIKNAEHRIMARRNDLLDQYSAAIQDQDADARQDVLEQIQEFNHRHRFVAITGSTLSRSIKGREQHERGTQDGVYLPKKRQPLRQEGAFANL